MLDKVLKLLPPETAHNLARWGMTRNMMAPGVFKSDRSFDLFGVRIDNPLGLAAGFDKNGVLVNNIHEYGFGFMEVGSVTNCGGAGNSGKRMFRVDDWDIANRMGLNGVPAHYVAETLRKSAWNTYGVSIAKTHSPDIMGDDAIRDITDCYDQVKNFGAYTAINISCPNTKEGRTFEGVGPLTDLLREIKVKGKGKPLVVKFGPGLAGSAVLGFLVRVCEDFDVDGYIVSNTMPLEITPNVKAGRSGRRLRPFALKTVSDLRQLTKKTIIGVGGIFTGTDAFLFHLMGADLFQAYNGFVRGPCAGPDFAHKVNKELEDLREMKCIVSGQLTPTYTSGELNTQTMNISNGV